MRRHRCPGTPPQWLGQRYGSRAMTVFFAATNMLSVCFVVLIIGGISIVMQKTLGLSNVESLLLVTVFVFSYIFIGGTYAHAYTNTLQAAIMIAVTLLILASGFGRLGPLRVLFDESAVQLGLRNPGVTATYGIFANALVAPPAALAVTRARRRRSYSPGPRPLSPSMKATASSQLKRS